MGATVPPWPSGGVRGTVRKIPRRVFPRLLRGEKSGRARRREPPLTTSNEFLCRSRPPVLPLVAGLQDRIHIPLFPHGGLAVLHRAACREFPVPEKQKIIEYPPAKSSSRKAPSIGGAFRERMSVIGFRSSSAGACWKGRRRSLPPRGRGGAAPFSAPSGPGSNPRRRQ